MLSHCNVSMPAFILIGVCNNATDDLSSEIFYLNSRPITPQLLTPLQNKNQRS